MWIFLIKINKRLAVVIPAVMAAGYLFGFSATPASLGSLKTLILPFTVLMVCPMMVTLNLKALQDGGKDVRLQLFAQGLNFAVVPFVAYGLGLVFFQGQPYLALGLLLASLLPASGMAISWTGFAKGNLAGAVRMTVIGLILGSLAIPFYVQGLMSARVEVSLLLLVRQIMIIVFLPMLLGYFARQILLEKYGAQEFKKTWAPRFSSLSTVGVLGMVFVVLALKARGISENPAILSDIFVPLLIMYLLNFGLSIVICRLFFNRTDTVALVYGTVMRNLSIALAVAVNAFGAKGADAALVIAVSYIIQLQSAVWCVKFNERIFGPAPSVELR